MIMLGNIGAIAEDAMWTPASLTLAAWWDAADESTIIEGDPGRADQWNDKTGRGKHLTSLGTQRPLTGDALKDINGHNVLSFEAPRVMGIPDLETDISSVCYVVKSDITINAATTLRPLFQFNEVIGYGSLTALLANEVLTIANVGNGRCGISQSNLIVDTNPHFYCLTKPTGAPWRMSLDGGADIRDLLYAGYDKLLVNGVIGLLGRNSSGTAFWPGDIAEIVMAAGEFAEGDRQKIEGYFAWKWGLVANLPVGHPYKTTYPRA